MKRQEASQENVNRLLEYIKENYNIETRETLFAPHDINLMMKDTRLRVDTSQVSQFELIDDKLTFITHIGETASTDLKEYRKEVK